MRINLDVPYEQRDLARRRGAFWDRGRKTWFIENVSDIGPFLRWIPRHLTKPHGSPQEAIASPRSDTAQAAGVGMTIEGRAA